jgi:hypothetical protein
MIAAVSASSFDVVELSFMVLLGFPLTRLYSARFETPAVRPEVTNACGDTGPNTTFAAKYLGLEIDGLLKVRGH